jgi:hypothetical protein
MGALIHLTGQRFQFIVAVVDGFGRKKKTPLDGGRFGPEGLVVIRLAEHLVISGAYLHGAIAVTKIAAKVLCGEHLGVGAGAAYAERDGRGDDAALGPLPQTLTTAPVSKRNTLTALKLAARSTTKWLFWRTWNEEFPSTKIKFDPGPVMIASPLWMVWPGGKRGPLSRASPVSSTTLLRCCACAPVKPPMAVQAQAACMKLRRYIHINSSALHPAWGPLMRWLAPGRAAQAQNCPDR